MAIALFKKHDAELNESLVLARSGILTDYVQYDTVVSSLEGLYETLDDFRKRFKRQSSILLFQQKYQDSEN